MLQTADGYINIGVGGPTQWIAFCKAIGHPDMATEEGFATQDDRLRNRPSLAERLSPIMRGKTSQEWLAIFDTYSVPAGPIYRMDEVFADPQVRHLGIRQSVAHPELGEIDLVGHPITLSRTPAAITHPLPDKGEQTIAVLAEAGFDEAEIAGFKQAGVI